MKRLIAMAFLASNVLVAMNSGTKPTDQDKDRVAAIKAFDLCERTCMSMGSKAECTAQCWADYYVALKPAKEENSKTSTKK